MFEEHQQIVLTEEIFGDDGTELKPGDVGAIVHIHSNKESLVKEALVVEFTTLGGDTVAIATVLPSQARPVTSEDMTHARNTRIAV